MGHRSTDFVRSTQIIDAVAVTDEALTSRDGPSLFVRYRVGC